MATGIAIAGVVLGGASYSQGRKAAKTAAGATALSAEQQKQVTAEEIRRQEYTHARDISSIEAEIAGMGISSTGEGLRGERAATPYDARIAELEGDVIPSIKEESEAWEFTWDSGMTRLSDIAGRSEKSAEELEDLKYKQSREKGAPWSPEGGMFSEYLMEKERVHISEIAWMKKTGLSAVASIAAEGQSAQAAARQIQISGLSQIASSAANWWDSSQPPANTTTTQQTVD